MRGLNLTDTKKLVKFNHVRELVAKDHALQNEDVLVDMEKIYVNEQLDISLPNGTFHMTEWAQRQLGTLLGVQWGKWFNPTLVTHKEIQEELQRRFSKTHEKQKMRTTKFKGGSPGVPGCDGYLRAVLSPTYHPIDNERLFDRLEKRFGSQVENLNFMSNHLSKKAHWSNDHCSHYTLVGEPINMGPIDRLHTDPAVRRVYDMAEKEGQLPQDDLVYPGFHMRNSEVGFTAITIDEFSFRLVCLNGCMITVGDSRLMYRQHRPIEDAELDKQFSRVFERIPVRWEDTRQRMVRMQGVTVEHPEALIEEELKRLEAPKYFRDAAIKAFAEEPIKNNYGVLQAVTRAAQDIESMDKRFGFEALAGQIMRRLS